MSGWPTSPSPTPQRRRLGAGEPDPTAAYDGGRRGSGDASEWPSLRSPPGGDPGRGPVRGPGPRRPRRRHPSAPTGSPTPGGDAHARAVPPDLLPGAGDTEPDGHFRGRAGLLGAAALAGGHAAPGDLPAARPRSTSPRRRGTWPRSRSPRRWRRTRSSTGTTPDAAAGTGPGRDAAQLSTPRGWRGSRRTGYRRLGRESDTMLSPTGEYLGFQQRRLGILVLTLATGEVAHGRHQRPPRGCCTGWGRSDLWLPVVRARGGEGPIYSANKTGKRTGYAKMSAPSGTRSSRFSGPHPYRWRKWDPAAGRRAGPDVDGRCRWPGDEETPSQLMRVHRQRARRRKSLLVLPLLAGADPAQPTSAAGWTSG